MDKDEFPDRHRQFSCGIQEIPLDEPYTVGNDGSGGEIVWFETYIDADGKPRCRVAGTGPNRPEPLH